MSSESEITALMIGPVLRCSSIKFYLLRHMLIMWAVRRALLVVCFYLVSRPYLIIKSNRYNSMDKNIMNRNSMTILYRLE